MTQVLLISKAYVYYVVGSLGEFKAEFDEVVSQAIPGLEKQLL